MLTYSQANRGLALSMLVLLVLAPMTGLVQGPPAVALDATTEPSPSVAGLENYRLYLDAENSSAGGDGHITTIEPSGSQEELSALSGIEFRSSEMISDLTIYGEGSDNDQIQLTIYMRFRGQQGSTGDVAFSLKAGDSQIGSENIDLDDPCTSTLQQNCAWTSSEVFFDISSNGVTVPNGKSLKLVIDGQASCEGQGGSGNPFGGGNECDIEIAFGDLDSTDGYSRLEVMANALSASSVKVHTPGSAWGDPETLTWAPNALGEDLSLIHI